MNAYILAGGQSKRMGQDKGLLPLAGKCLVEHVIDGISEKADKLILITANEAYGQFNLPLIKDEVEGQGPAQGVLTALEHSNSEWNLILSCDMPLINLILSPFNDLSMENEIICFKNEHIFPFPAFYNQSIRDQWKEKMMDGERQMTKLIDSFKTHYLKVENEHLFLNVNTEEDLRSAEQILNNG